MSAFRIPWYIPDFDAADAEAVKQVVLSGYVNQGPVTRAFDDEVKNYFDIEYAVTTPSGTTSLSLALMALGIGHGDTVLIPDLTFIGTAGAVRLAGAEPILADVNPHDFNLDPDDAKKRIQPSTKAVIAVHLNGRPADLDGLKTLNLPIIEDAAQALGSKNQHGLLGTQSEAGCFSLAPTKIITGGQCGFIITKSCALFDRLRQLKDHGRLDHTSDDHLTTGFNFKVTDMQTALALSQWKKLSARIKRAKEIDTLYGFETPKRPAEGYLCWPDFVSEDRDKVLAHMTERGIQLRPFWPALHTQKAYASTEAFPGATEASRRGCWLPCSPTISNQDIQDVLSAFDERS